MDSFKCEPPADCCEKLLANSSSIDSTDFIYSYLYVCTFQMNSYVSFGVFAMFLIFLISFMSTTKAVAEGATLLALGNGASDIVSTAVASSNDIFVAVGGALGAGLFISTITTAATILTNSKEVQMNSKIYIKYTTVYMNGLLLLILYIFDVSSFITNNIQWLLLGLYAGFVLYAVIWDRKHRSEEQPMGRSKPSEPILIEMKPITRRRNEQEEGGQSGEESLGEIEMNNETNRIAVEVVPQNESGSRYPKEEESESEGMKQRIRKIMIRGGQYSWARIKRCVFRVSDIVELPSNFIRMFTVPPATSEDWDINYTPLSIIGLSLLCYLVMPCIFPLYIFIVQYEVIPYISLSLLIIFVSMLAAALLRFWVPPSYQKGHIILAYLGLFSGILWIWLTANHIVSIISIIGYITELQPFYLGVIILGIGNSLNDLFADMALAKMGYPKMALTGCISSPLFNTLIGLGVSFAIYHSSGQKYVFRLDNLDTILTLFSLVCLLSYKLFTIGIVSKSKYFVEFANNFASFFMTKEFAHLLIFFYCFFAIAATVFCFIL